MIFYWAATFIGRQVSQVPGEDDHCKQVKLQLSFSIIILSFKLSRPIFVRWLVFLFLEWALFQPNKLVGIRHAGGPGLNPGPSPTIRVLYQRENVILMSKTLWERAITIPRNYDRLLLALFPSSFLSLIIRFEPISVRPTRIFAMSVRLIAQNFADNGTINAPKYTSVPSQNSETFAIITFAQCCWRPNCHYCWKRKGNVSELVWSATSFVSLTIYSTGWEDNNKLMNGPIFLLFFFFFFYAQLHSCVNNCIDLLRVKTVLLKRSFYPWHLHYSSGPACSNVL